MPLPKEKAWFTAKPYGWGWTFPMRWQGWVVTIAFLVALFGGLPVALEGRPIEYILYAWALCAALIAVCYWKGEKPRGR